MSDKNNMSEEDYLKKHLEDLESGKNKGPVNNSDIPFVVNPSEGSRVTDLQFFNFDVKELPCGKFYPTGTLLMVSPAQVRGILA
jgi:ATP-dependent RNA circularization protein (DNA/RNA ligase family)